MENIHIGLDQDGDKTPVFPQYLDDKLLVTVLLPITTILTKYFVEIVLINETTSYNDNQTKELKIADYTRHATLVLEKWKNYADYFLNR